jgi:2-dehydro-3-deoxygluconokinase
MPELMQLCTVILGDLGAFDLYSGIKGTTDSEILHEFSTKYPAVEYVTMTRREGFTATHNTYQGILWHKGVIYTSAVYDMPDMTDRIGGGDAFMAGIIHGAEPGEHVFCRKPLSFQRRRRRLNTMSPAISI